MVEYCLNHTNTELIPAEDTGEPTRPTCWVCTAIRVAELADSWGIIGPDGQDRTGQQGGVIARVLEQA